MTLKCPDPDLRVKLSGHLSPYFIRTLVDAETELENLLLSERGEFLLTYDANFVRTLDDIRKQRMIHDIQRNLPAGDEEEDDQTSWTERMLRTFQLSYRTREEQAVHEIYDYLKSYYYAARTRFTDCVCLQVIERHFLGARGSVQVFNPALVGRMTPEELRGIAGEDFSVVQMRRGLLEKMERLDTARVIATAGYV